VTIHDEFVTERHSAMKAGEKAKVNAIRQVESEVSVARAAKGFDGATDEDDLYRSVIAAYVKKMDKARREYLDLGDAGSEQAAKLGYEVEYLSGWLPDDGVDEEAVRQLVRTAIAELAVTDPKMAGRVTGHVMGRNRGLDGSVVNRLVREELER